MGFLNASRGRFLNLFTVKLVKVSGHKVELSLPGSVFMERSPDRKVDLLIESALKVALD